MLIEPEEQKTIPAIFAAYERRKRDVRFKLGASDVGEECELRLWNRFRWVYEEKRTGQELRLFETGHFAEPRLVADLRSIGVEIEVTDGNGKQWVTAVWAMGHYESHADGIILSGLLESPKKQHLFEAKTMSEKYFKVLRNKGLALANPDYYDQHVAQLEEPPFDLKRGFFLAYNKNEQFGDASKNRPQDRQKEVLYSERLYPDPKRKEVLRAKIERIVGATESTDMYRIKDDKLQSWKCPFCPGYKKCFGLETEMYIPPMNCRTCAHSTPVENGEWECEFHHKRLSNTEQLVGCGSHLFIPTLLTVDRPTTMTEDTVEYPLFINHRGGKVEIRTCT
jgi:hypothetical protein